MIVERQIKTRGCASSPSPEGDLGRAVGFATALALAGVLSLATGISGLTAALTLAGIHAFAAVGTRGSIGVISQQSLGGGADCGRQTAVGGGGMQTRGGTGHQTGDGDRGEHGFCRLEEAWIFHFEWFLFWTLYGGPDPARHQPGEIGRCSVGRGNSDFIPIFVSTNPTCH